MLLFAQTMSSIQSGGLLLTVLVIGILFILNLFLPLQPFNPLMLVSDHVAMLAANYDLSTLGSSIMITICLTGIFLGTALIIFKNKRI